MVEAAEDEYSEDENDRLRGGQANRAGVGDEGEGEESLVNGGDMVSPGPTVLGGLRANLGGVMGGRVVPFMAIRNFRTHKQGKIALRLS